MTLASKFGKFPQHLPKKSPYCTDTRSVGIEIEQEYGSNSIFRSITPVTDDSPYWQHKHDGSLREIGVEFVSGILFPGDVDAALEEVMPLVSKGTFSWRTAIHVHIDVRDLSEEQLTKVCELYSVIEPLIFEWEGNNRNESRFCVPWYACPAAVKKMLSVVNNNNNDVYVVQNAFEKFGKYSALNLTSIPRFGTLEFRHMQTTDNIDKIRKYINLCLRIVEAGSNLIDAGYELSRAGAENFIREVFNGDINFLEGGQIHFDSAWRGIDVVNSIKLSMEKPKTKRVSNKSTLKTQRYISTITNVIKEK